MDIPLPIVMQMVISSKRKRIRLCGNRRYTTEADTIGGSYVMPLGSALVVAA
jgi:hypothetical protein